MGQDLHAFYDDYYDGTETEWRRIGAVDKVANLLRLWHRYGDSVGLPDVLEIGCGEGAVLAELGYRGCTAKGVEISRSGAEIALDKGLDVRIVDGVGTGYEDRSFDVVLLTHVVEHLENPRETLTEAARVGRWVVVEVPLEYRWRTPRNFQPNAVGHINLYNMKLIRQLLQSMGLEVVGETVSNPSVEVFEYSLGSWKGRIKWMLREGGLRVTPFLAQKVFAYHGTLLCREGNPPVPATL